MMRIGIELSLAGSTLVAALIPWLINGALLSILLVIGVGRRVHFECLTRVLLSFGLFPYFIFAFVIFALFPSDSYFLGLKVYVPQTVCAVLTCAFPCVYAASVRFAALDPRLRDLAFLCGPTSHYTRSQVLLPLSADAYVMAIKTAWPISVLVILLFEWGRGEGGLGALIQGTISTREYIDIFRLIALIALVSALPYWALDRCEKLVRRRLALDSIDLYPSGAQRAKTVEFDRGRGLRPATCYAGSAVAFLIAWQSLFALTSYEPSQSFTPARFVEELYRVALEGRLGYPNFPRMLAGALTHSIELALLGAVCGTIFAAVSGYIAGRWRVVDAFMAALIHLSQAVPIFIYIPLLLLAFPKWGVALGVVISVTFFRAYEFIRAELAAAATSWKELVRLSGSGSIGVTWRKLRAVDARLGLHATRNAFVLVFPYSILGAVVADLFLNLNGLGWLVSQYARGDVFVTLVVCLIMLLLATAGELFARWVQNYVPSLR
jgi:ABC-type nitrate/sulfonate/bicarbonate transport system permease component